MNNFKKGDILLGTKNGDGEAEHPIVYISGNQDAPLAVVLTHSSTVEFPCNIKMLPVHFKNGYYKNKVSYFISHLIEKMSEWGPYYKIDRLTNEGVIFIESQLSRRNCMTWKEYEDFRSRGCIDHK